MSKIFISSQNMKTNYKENGAVYTPYILAEYIAQKTMHYFLQDYKENGGYRSNNRNNINKIHIVDPACGDGVLLEAIWNEFKNIQLPLKIEDTIHGIDIEKKAIDDCKRRLSTFLENKSDIKSLRLVNTNALCPFNEKSLARGWRKIRDRFGIERGFDILIANPPWGADISKYKDKLSKNDFKTLNGQFDSYELFIELALVIVREGGYFSFIIPDSILNDGKRTLRNILLKNTQMKLISRLGEKIFPRINRSCIVLICKNSRPHPLSKTDCFRLNRVQRKMILGENLKFHEAEKTVIHKVKQRRFLLNKNNKFDIDLKESEMKVLEKIKNTTDTLQKYLANSRGVELSGNGKICQCPSCDLWMPYPKSTPKNCPHCKSPFEVEKSFVKYIVHEEKAKNMVSLISGHDIKRYQCKPSKWLEVGIPGINYKEPDLFKGKKLLIRKTGVGISASIDYSGSHTNQVVYIFKLKQGILQTITLEFILSLINSRAYFFYIAKTFGENEWRSHPYLTQKQIIDLPFPKIKNEKQKNMIRETTKLVSPYLQKGLELPKHIDSKVEYLISVICGLAKADYEIIYEAINEAQELIPIKALKGIEIDEIF